MSITEHEEWDVIKPHFKIEKCADGTTSGARVRIEVVSPEHDFLFLTMPCVACGREIYPIRERRSPAGRRPNPYEVGQTYFAATCPLDVNIGCSRGMAAREEYLKVRQAIGG